MSIELKESGFREWHDYYPGRPGVGVESDRLDACLAHYRQHGFQGLFGTPSYGFRQDNLDFLRQATDATWLWFWDIELRQIDALYELTNLAEMGIHPKRPGINFSRFPKLRTVTNHWVKGDTNLAGSTIAKYYLWHFKPKSKSFADAEIPLGVTYLDLTWANPASLDGLPVLKKLKTLQIHRCRNLSNLSALPQIAPQLEKLLVTTSSNIDTSQGVLDHPTLKSALLSGTELLGKGA